MECVSCGMTMEKSEEFGGHKVGNKSCVYCSDSEGILKPKNEVREGMVNFWMQRESIDRSTAEEKTDEYMSKMPAWKS
ncbi:MAG: zinc ribbon domain-containing protein [Candidatus Thorarchaeota archaeon]